MSLLVDLVASGWIAPLAMLILWAETILLSRKAAEPGRRFVALAANAMSGTCLLAAVWAALVAAHAGLVALCLAGSFIAHLADVILRLRSG